jgi:hypothetical protein
MLSGLDQAHLFSKRRGRTEIEFFEPRARRSLVSTERALEPADRRPRFAGQSQGGMLARLQRDVLATQRTQARDS